MGVIANEVLESDLVADEFNRSLRRLESLFRQNCGREPTKLEMFYAFENSYSEIHSYDDKDD